MLRDIIIVIALTLVSRTIGASAAGIDELTVTCGSVVKLTHKETQHNLHSHAIAWGSGSSQQSVTATGSQNDQGSLWLIKDASNAQSVCEIGQPVKCGMSMRLEHVQTGKNLHSHLFKAPLSGNQEVSGFGEGGSGDTGDNWTLLCESGDDYWQRKATVSFMHVDTSKYLYTADKVKFTQSNCGQQCPIMGQTEVSVSQKRDSHTKWIAGQGVYFPAVAKKDEGDEL